MNIRQSRTKVKISGLCCLTKWRFPAIKWWPKLKGVLMCRLGKGLMGLVFWAERQGWLFQAVLTDRIRRGKGGSAGANGPWAWWERGRTSVRPWGQGTITSCQVICGICTTGQHAEKNRKIPRIGKRFWGIFLFLKKLHFGWSLQKSSLSWHILIFITTQLAFSIF